MNKQSENAAVAAAPQPLRIGDKTYLVNQPTDSDTMAISMQITKRGQTPLARIMNDPFFAKMSDAQQNISIAKAADKQVAGSQELDMQEFLAGLISPDILAFAIWLLARKNHPGLQKSELSALINADNAMEVYVEFNEASGMANLGKN